MKITTQKLEATKLQLDIEIPPDIVKKEFEEVYSSIGKEAKIPGYRQGKAPRDILEKHHKSLASQEVIKNLVWKVYHEHVEKEKIDVVELPEISEVKLEANTLTFKATIEVMPKIELKNYTKIKLTHQKAQVTAEDIDKVLNELKQAHKADVIDDKFARGLGYSDLDEMKSAIEKQMFVQKDSQIRAGYQEKIMKHLMEAGEFKLPQALINRRFQELYDATKSQMARYGMSKEQIEAKDADLKKELHKQAGSEVKGFLILQEIARKENLAFDDKMTSHVMEFLLREADWNTD